ncbi:hypothetical protein V7182_18875 [Neobacillus drentensis]|uniref:hypothetical protein n=1 Tax=Neobacillus drentensis TaxID=220684 RepID=UPI002FFE94A4
MAKAKQLPTFELINKYNEETEKQHEVAAKHREEVTHAQALVQALNFRYEEAVKDAVVNNADNAQLVDELSEQLTKAERDLANKKRMQQVAASYNKRTITRKDVERELKTFQNTYQSEVMKPAMKELRKAKEAYISAYLDCARKVAHFDEQARHAFITVNPSYKGYNVPYSVGFTTRDDVSSKSLTDADLRELSRGLQPSSLKPLMRAVREASGRIYYVPVEGDNE